MPNNPQKHFLVMMPKGGTLGTMDCVGSTALAASILSLERVSCQNFTHGRHVETGQRPWKAAWKDNGRAGEAIRE